MTDPRYLPDDSLLAQYANFEDGLPEVVVVSESSAGCFHRQDPHTDEAHAMCRDTGEWVPAELEDALAVCNDACTFCFKAGLEEHADRDDSTVARRKDATAPTVEDGDLDLLGRVATDDIRPPLTAPPREVLHAGGSQVYHAPTEHGAYCGRKADYQRKELSKITGNVYPCSGCFVVEAIDEPETPEPPQPSVGD